MVIFRDFNVIFTTIEIRNVTGNMAPPCTHNFQNGQLVTRYSIITNSTSIDAMVGVAVAVRC
jgi:hypothetical protein